MALEPLIQKVRVEPDGVTDAFKTLGRAAAGYQDAAEDAAGVTAEFTESAGEAADSADDVASSTSRAAQTIDKMKNSSSAAIRGMGQLAGKIRSAATAGRVLAATGIAAVLLGISSAIVKATSKAIAFENELNEVRKTAGLTEAQFLDLQGSLLDIQADLGTSQKELAGIAAEAGRLGVEAPRDIAEFTRTVAKMSNATVVSADKAAEGLAKILNAFRQPVTEAERLGSVINELSNSAAANTQQIIAAVQRMGGAANQINLTANEAAAFATTLQDLGVNARQSGTALRSVFGRIIPQAEKVAQIMGTTQEQVIQAFEEDGRAAVLSFLESLQEMDTAARASALKDLFGTEQQGRVARLVQNMDALRQQLGRASDEAREVDSLTEEMVATTKDVANEWGRLTAKLSSWLADFGSNFTGMLESALSKMNELFGGAEEARRSLIEANSRMTTVQEGQRLLDQFHKLKRAGEDTSEIKEDLQAAFGEEFFQETADGVEVLDESLQQLINRRREAASADLEEERKNVLQEINKQVQLLKQNQARAAAVPKGTEQWEGFREEVHKSQNNLDALLEGLAATLPNEVERAKEITEGLIEDTTFSFDIAAAPALNEDPSALMDRVQEAVSEGASRPDEDGDGIGPPEGEAGPGFDQGDALDAQQKLNDAVRQEVRRRRLAKAETEAERERLQGLFDLQDRIRRLQKRKTELQDALVGATESQRSRMKETIQQAEQQLQILRKQKQERREAAQGDAPEISVPTVEPQDTVAMAEDVAESLEEGFPSFSELVMGEGEGFGGTMQAFNDRITELRLKLHRDPNFGQQDFAREASKAAKEYKQELLGIVETLEEMGLLTPEMAKEAAAALGEVEEKAGDAKEETENLGEALQDSARLVRGIGDLASNFGDLSDEAESAIDSTATVLDNVGRLVELSSQAGGFSNIFSSFSGAVSGVSGILGAVGGVVSLISSFGGGDSGMSAEEFRELQNEIKENTRALGRNTEALLSEDIVGSDISANTVETVQSVVTQLDESLEQVVGGKETDLTEQEIRDLLTQLEETGIEAFDGIVDLFDNKLEQFGDPGGALASIMNETGDFPGLKPVLDSLLEEFGQFGDSLGGLIKEIELRAGMLGQGIEQIRSVLVDRLGDVGFDDPLTDALTGAIEGLDLDDEESVESFLDNLTKAFIGEGDLSFLGLDQELTSLLGEASPAEFEELLNTLRENLLGGSGEEGGGFSTSAQVQRTITEFQANELLALQQEIAELGRQQRDLLTAVVEGVGGELPEGGEASMAGGPEAQDLGALSAAFESGAALSAVGGGRPAQQHVSKTVGGDVYNIDIGPIDGDLPPREIARKLDDAIRNHLRRRAK